MKKLLFKLTILLPIVTIVTVIICNNADAQIKLKTDGKVGIGILNPETQFHVHGDNVKFSFPTGMYNATPLIIDRYYDNSRFYPYTDNEGYIGLNDKYWYKSYIFYGIFDFCTAIKFGTPSDKSLKKNSEQLTKTLDKILKIKAYKYDLDFSAMESEHLQRLDTSILNNHYGFIAQELLEIYPELVIFDTASNVYSIDYVSFVPILVTAMQEQHKKIKELEEKIKDKDTEEKNAIEDNIITSQTCMLEQNNPNPFNEDTTIEYFLPSTVQNATLYVYDLQGKQLKGIQISERDYGYITIYGNELQPGIYHYSLVADGQIVGIEKMILTD